MARHSQPSDVAFGSRTDIGCVREHNEDSLCVAPPLFVVADGMGGHAAGEVASEIAVEVISELAPQTLDADALCAAVEQANLAIIQAAHEGRGRRGMGTTCTAAMIEGQRLIIAQVGDSRAYLFHEGALSQLTRDHSLVAELVEAGEITPEEARFHPRRSAITRALGSDPRTSPDLYDFSVSAGDRLLLCSDGLTSMLSDKEIADIMAKADDPQRCASRLVSAAIAAGGLDNVTVIVVNITGNAPIERRRVARKTKITAAVIVCALIAIIACACAAFVSWTQQSAYLIAQDGNVALYRGVPGEFFGMRFSELDHVTDIKVDDLQPGLANRLKTEGVTTSLSDAEKLLSDYEKQANGEADDDGQADGQVDARTNGNANAPANVNANAGEGDEENAS